MADAYYNEVDPYCAQWLRNLIAAGHIAPGDVDERSIEDVKPDDLRGYSQCHFFAGIGVWSYALRLAGWPDDRSVWTGSCPCQPFSAAGKGAGFADQRHLWPAWFHLIRECRPGVVLGEQVASRDGLDWLDLVHADLEGARYAVGAVDICSAGIGAPHIRQRLHFVAHADEDAGRWNDRAVQRTQATPSFVRGHSDRFGNGRHTGSLANSHQDGCGTPSGAELHHAEYQAQPRSKLADADGGHAGSERLQRGGEYGQQSQDGGLGIALGDTSGTGLAQRVGLTGVLGSARRAGEGEAAQRAGVHAGFWSNAEWIACRDGKARPIEPGSFPLVDGAAFRLGSGSPYEGRSRQGMLRAYGNAINAELAAAFVRAVAEVLSAPAQQVAA